MAAQPDFSTLYTSFEKGFAPLAHLDKHTFIGDDGQASQMKNIDVISQPGVLKQGPGLLELTNNIVVDEQINHIMDRSVKGGETYGIGDSKLFKIIPGEIVDDADFPRSITGCEQGESVIDMNGNLFYFYNKSAEGEIGVYDDYSTFDDDWGSTTDLALEKAPHPSAKKEDILVFGNGRYLGTYIEGLGMLDTKKLDFGEGSQVADVIYHANTWYIAVNSGDDTDNRTSCQLYMYDGSAMSNILTDEAGVGVQRIGFLFTHNGRVFASFEDLTSPGYIIGYLNGRVLEPLRYFEGELPKHNDKSLYKNTILFANQGKVYSCGASVAQVSNQISSIAEGRHEEVGALAAPFGDMLVASSGESANSLDKFDGYNDDSEWSSISTRSAEGRRLGQVDNLIVQTKPLEENASCKIRVIGDEGQKESSWKEISGEGKTRHLIKSIDIKNLSDFKVKVKWESDTPCPIRNITALGHYVSN